MIERNVENDHLGIAESVAEGFVALDAPRTVVTSTEGL